MMRLSIGFAVYFCLGMASCSNEVTQDNPADVNTPNATENIAYSTLGDFTAGEFIDSVYSNSFFGFTLPVIEGWDVILLNNTRFDQVTDSLSSDSLVTDPSEDNYFQLITLQMNDFLPLVNFMVEKTEPIPNVSNAKEYLAYTENYIMENSQTEYTRYISHVVVETSVGGRPFLNQTFTVNFGEITQFQRNYCVQFDDYIFTIITHYGNKAELDVVNELLDGIIWKNPS